jgi:hypothetical protein
MRVTASWAATSAACSTPYALSHNAVTGIPGSTAVTRSTSAGDSTFGSRTSKPVNPASAARSSAEATRTCSTQSTRADDSHSTTAARAVALSAGGTASSRSRITRSAPVATALSKRSGRLPGT